MSAEVTDADRELANELRWAVQLGVYARERDAAGERIAQALADQRAAVEARPLTDETPGIYARLVAALGSTEAADREVAAMDWELGLRARVEALADKWDTEHTYGCCTRLCLHADGRHVDPTDPILASELLGMWSDNPPPVREHRTIPCPRICTCASGPWINALRAALGPRTAAPCTARHDVTDDGVTAGWFCTLTEAHDEHADSIGRRWTE